MAKGENWRVYRGGGAAGEGLIPHMRFPVYFILFYFVLFLLQNFSILWHKKHIWNRPVRGLFSDFS